MEKEKQYYKHNFFAFLWHGIFLYIANAFTQITTVQASLIYFLTGSSFLSGVLFSANRIGSVIPQVFFVNWVEKTKIKKHFLIAAVLIRGTSMLVIAGLLFGINRPKSPFTLTLIFIVMLVFFLSGGMGDISYYAVFSKTVNPRKRGKLFGLKYFIGGILGLGAGYLTKHIFTWIPDFPQNYALLYAASGVALYIAFAGFSALKELPDKGRKSHSSWYGHFRLLREHPNFLKFILVEMLLMSVIILMPLYVIYAKKELLLSFNLIGFFVTAQIAGEIIGGPIWGKIGDRYNFRLVLFLIGLLSMFTPIMALFLPAVNRNLYISVFFMIGLTFKGLSLGISNYLLEIAPKEAVPSYVAVKNFMQLPTVLYPLIGGFLVDYISFAFLFIGVSILLLLGSILSATLHCERSQFKTHLSLLHPFR